MLRQIFAVIIGLLVGGGFIYLMTKPIMKALKKQKSKTIYGLCCLFYLCNFGFTALNIVFFLLFIPFVQTFFKTHTLLSVIIIILIFLWLCGVGVVIEQLRPYEGKKYYVKVVVNAAYMFLDAYFFYTIMSNYFDQYNTIGWHLVMAIAALSLSYSITVIASEMLMIDNFHKW